MGVAIGLVAGMFLGSLPLGIVLGVAVGSGLEITQNKR
jgi:hypothetical protein